MASVIKTRTISAVVDNRIQLANSNFARPLPAALVGAWTKIRVGVRLIMDNTAADLGSTPKFSIGLCSGSTNLLLDATTTHFVGVQSTLSSWTYTAGPPVFYGTNNITFSPTKRVGSTVTQGTALGTGAKFMADPTTTNRFMFFVDITTGSPNFTIAVPMYRDLSTAGDVTLTNFLAQVELASPSFTLHGAVSGQTLAVNEGVDGTLNHATVAWDRTTPVIEICDLAVVRIT